MPDFDESGLNAVYDILDRSLENAADQPGFAGLFDEKFDQLPIFKDGNARFLGGGAD